jgi:hypothetical protein
MMTWYELSEWGPRITPVAVERETDLTVFLVGGRRRLKSRDFFPTWEEAKAELIRRLCLKVDQARNSLQYYEERLLNAGKMKPEGHNAATVPQEEKTT